MTPEQKIKAAIIKRGDSSLDVVPARDFTAETIDDLYEEMSEDWRYTDAEYEFREGDVETGIECDWSHHYECKSVAAKAPDGSWVGWTYWYGGGKHGNPQEIEWMEHAYDLNVTEEEKLVTVQTFAKA